MVGGALQRTAIALPRSRDLRAPWSPQQNCAALRSSCASPVSRPRPQAGLSTWSASVSGVPYATSAPRKRLETCNRPSDLGRAGSPAWHPSYSADATPSRIIHNVVQAGYRCGIDEGCTGRILHQRFYLSGGRLDSSTILQCNTCISPQHQFPSSDCASCPSKRS